MAHKRRLPVGTQRPAPPPAKLTRPAAAGLLRRDRLFRCLDAGAPRVVWVSGPAGCGKTSLLSTWIETRGIATLWYRIDAGDADLGTFFQFLRRAVRERHGTELLPAFAPGHLGTLDAFARGFFESWFGCFDQAITLVFDSYEQVSPDARVDEMLAALLAAMPRHVRVIVMSRRGPPATLARWEASPDLLSLAWDQLRFSDDESAALAASWGVHEGDVLGPITEASRGWAAGMVLMLRAARAGIALGYPRVDARRGLFNYFATEIFASLSTKTQDFLIRTAFLPEMTAAMAQVLTGEPRTQRILGQLHADNFFVESRPQPDAATTTYEYHPLFREFLCAQAKDTLGAAMVDDIRRQAAALLEAGGQVDAAARLLIDASDAARLAVLITQHAEEMVQRARFVTLQAWIGQLPPAETERSPWLLLWLGTCKLASRDPSAHATLERAKQLADETADIVASFAVREWMIVAAPTAQESAALCVEVQTLVERHWSSMGRAEQVKALTHFRLDLRSPQALTLLRNLGERTGALLEHIEDLEEKLKLAAFVGSYAVGCGDLARQRSLEAEIHPLLDQGRGSLRVRAICLGFLSFYCNQCGTCEDNRRLLRELTALGDVGGFCFDQVNAWRNALRAALCGREFVDAARWERRLRPVARGAPWLYPSFLHSAVHLHLHFGDLRQAVNDANELHASSPPDSPLRALSFGMLGQIALDTGENARAAEMLEQALDAARRWQHPTSNYTFGLLLGLARFRCGDLARAKDCVREALRFGRESGLIRNVAIVDRLVAEVFVFALRHGIEPDTVGRLIAALELPPPSEDVEEWPWPNRVRTLGSIAVEQRHGTSPGNRRRVAKKPLELLLFLVSRDGGPVAASLAIDALWPDAYGDAAKKTFDITLHRLRRMLRADAAIRLEGGQIALNWQYCWVDALAFTRVVDRIESTASTSSETTLSDMAARALALYRGHFLGEGGDETPWAAAYREKLRAQFMRLVVFAGTRRAAQGRDEDAERLYRKALELDPVAEAIYRRLMQSLAGRGETAAAINVYGRCRDMLSILLATKPSAETTRIYERIRGA